MARVVCLLNWIVSALLVSAPLAVSAQDRTFMTAQAPAEAPERPSQPVTTTGSPVSRTLVTSAILEASTRTGASYDYLLATAQIESGLDPEAQARTSSASGLFQFIESTWLASIERHSERLSRLEIEQSDLPLAFLADPNISREAVLEMRRDPRLAAYMAAIDTKDNARAMRQALGRVPTHAELYLAHFLGRNGATQFVRVLKRNPKASAARLFPAAARANRPVFYDAQGRARSVEGVRRVVAQKLENALDALREQELSTAFDRQETQNNAYNQKYKVHNYTPFWGSAGNPKPGAASLSMPLNESGEVPGNSALVANSIGSATASASIGKSVYNERATGTPSGDGRRGVSKPLPTLPPSNSSLAIFQTMQAGTDLRSEVDPWAAIAEAAHASAAPAQIDGFEGAWSALSARDAP